jgi:hypothetical protein
VFGPVIAPATFQMRARNALLSLAILSALPALSAAGETCLERRTSSSHSDAAFVMVVVRSAGNTPAQMAATDYYRFTVARNGRWEFTPQFRGEPRNGKLGADEIDRWMKALKDGGLCLVESDPELGAADEPYMDIMVNANETPIHIRIRLADELSQAIEENIVEVVMSDK